MSKTASIFQNVGGARTPHTVFDLSYSHKTTMKIGPLYPVACDEVVPGDRLKIGNQVIIRFQPLVAPVLHNINAFLHWFFVPYRLLSDESFDWEKFITGGDFITDEETGEKVLEGDSQVLPRWTPTEGKNGVGSLWDHLGFPANVNPVGAEPLDFPRRAYNFIYNEYYRDENLIEEVSLDNEDLLFRCYEKDYFTSSLPFQQKGTSPAIPIHGSAQVLFNEDVIVPLNLSFSRAAESSPSSFSENITEASGRTFIQGHKSSGNYVKITLNGENVTIPVDALNNNILELGNLATADVNDLRLAFQIQKWLERNARAGSRYTEFLRSHYGVSPRDDRLQRPEYIGGMRAPVIVQEVLQTSSTDSVSPQGNLAGKAIVGSKDFCGSYNVKEFGLIMCIMSVIPRTNYMDGINRQWLRRSRYDFFSPEFQNLSEQGIEVAEVFASNSEADNTKIFGFQGRYDEMRIKPNIVSGLLRSSLDYWHLGRKFDTVPFLNKEFIEVRPEDNVRIFAEQTEDCMIVEVGNAIRAVRPLGYIAEPGLIDHV